MPKTVACAALMLIVICACGTVNKPATSEEATQSELLFSINADIPPLSLLSSSASSAGQLVASMPLIISGEGGPSSALVRMAARTYQAEHGGVLAEVNTGDAFIAAVRNFVRDNGQVSTFVYFGHGNEVGLFVNQAPGVHGSIYANDPRLAADYSAASIYELSSALFAPSARAIFYGCNIARNHPAETFASAFANYFHATVVAATGPTEFSRKPDATDTHAYFSYLPGGYSGPVYMVPTDPAHGFLEVAPSPGGIGGYADVTENLQAAAAIERLAGYGLSVGSDGLFQPYLAVTYQTAQSFCEVTTIVSELCRPTVKDPSAPMRNLEALALLMDAKNIAVRKTPGSHLGYIQAAQRLDILTPGFVNRRWITRAEMAELTVRVMDNSH